MNSYPYGDARPPFVHALAAATAALALYVACCTDAFSFSVDVYVPQEVTYAHFAWTDCQPWLPYSEGVMECTDPGAMVTQGDGIFTYIGAPDLTVIDVGGNVFAFAQCFAGKQSAQYVCTTARDLIFADGAGQ